MDTHSFKETQAIPDASPHLDQTRAETAIRAVQDQDQRYVYPPLMGSSFPFLNNPTTPAYASKKPIRQGAM